MKNRLLIALFAFVGLIACKKHHFHSRYNYWQVNSDSFSSNNVDAGSSRMDLYFSGIANHSNRFQFTFPHAYFPRSGVYKVLVGVRTQYEVVTCSFEYKGRFYVPSPFSNTYITTYTENDKAKFVLPPTWFVYYNNVKDSVLIRGTFSEP